MKRRFRLLKDAPEAFAGAIFEESTSDTGDPIFECITPELFTEPHNTKEVTYTVEYGREIVLTQTHWFEEIEPVYLNKNLLEKFQQWIKTL